MGKLFIGPVLLSVAVFFGLYAWGGLPALALGLVLSALEISLSFDNAVINAKILERMSAQWRRRFLTWGMVVAVLGTRLVFPALLVSLASGLSPFFIAALAVGNPGEYGRLLVHAEPIIHAFGGAFLLMVSLKYFFDEAKSVHWIRFIERRLAQWGRFEAIEVAITLTALLVCALLVPKSAALILGAGALGIVIFILMEGVIGALGFSAAQIPRDGLALFIYLNVLDAAFSLDGVIGAFALTSQLLIIVAGLGIGAYFVRTFTLVLVRKGTLATLIYLEHGAYWAICALAFFMFASLVTAVPDVVVGSIGIFFIGSAYLSSLRARRPHPPLSL